jgi:hypothetical protein
VLLVLFLSAIVFSVELRILIIPLVSSIFHAAGPNDEWFVYVDYVSRAMFVTAKIER